ncbi:putative MFS family arabinose efflux permease [Salinibacterium sp. CAN_S4]|uniref:MFS transporter n=1 Tax=Salinibacterium sp. CAN_S4 TaxID=2787727 RepID=UPI0018F0025D
MFGKRRILLLLLAILVGGSIFCALSTTLVPLVIGRAFQGIGIGVIPLGISILRDVIHPTNLGGAVALVSATLGVGGALGLPLAATIAQFADWHWLFILVRALGLGVGFAYTAMPTLIMQSVPPHETAAANGLNSVMRTLGSTFPATLVGVAIVLFIPRRQHRYDTSSIPIQSGP